MAKKEKSPYDENGRWVEERGRIKGAIRRAFRLSPQMKDVLQKARVELPPALKKDGNPGKKNQVRYRCALCGKLFPQKWVQVDHIETVVPLWKNESEMTYDEIVRGVFCDVSNLQVVCSTPMKMNNNKPSCHRLKTNEENFIRDYLSKLKLEDRINNMETAKNKYLEYLKEKEEKAKKKEERKKAKLFKNNNRKG
jgi:hypothetical protein